ncbi:hypothetical protein [Amycolatopsis sp. NPDC003861]
MGRRLVRSGLAARRIAPAAVAALIAVAAAAAGFHEQPNSFQLASTLAVALLAALATYDFKKNLTESGRELRRCNVAGQRLD